MKHIMIRSEEDKHTLSMKCGCKPKLVSVDGKYLVKHHSVTGWAFVEKARKLLGINTPLDWVER